MADTMIDPPDVRASSSAVTAPSSCRSSTKLLTRLFELPTGTRLVAPEVSWAFYEEYISKIPENSPVRAAFDGRDLETMTPGYAHEVFEDLIGYLVTAIAEEQEISYQPAGSTTWNRPELVRGIEADRSYFFDPSKIAAASLRFRKKIRDVAGSPNPDLVIEIDLSAPRVDRPGIYAALGVAEVWRFDGEKVVIERLGAEGKYAAVEISEFLSITPSEVVRWLVDEDSSNRPAWGRRLRAWIRTELADRRQ
jgi:Uma2 family endonuclease